MSSALEKSFNLIEVLARHPAGLSLVDLARVIDQPQSGVHRTLQELTRLGYARQLRSHRAYVLTMKLPGLGLAFLGRAGIGDVAQPILDELAGETGELIRLSVIDDDKLVWVAVAQGATSGLRYDPGQEQGVVAHLATTSAGIAWLSTMDDDEVIARVSIQGLHREGGGAGAPGTLAKVREQIEAARRDGFSISIDSYIAGMGAMAVPVRGGEGGPVLGCLSIAGPAVRMTRERMIALRPLLAAAASELETVAGGSQYFQNIFREHENAEDAPLPASR